MRPLGPPARSQNRPNRRYTGAERSVAMSRLAVVAKGPGPGTHGDRVMGAEAREDAALVAAAAQGDAAAFRTLVDRHLAGVLAVARRMLRDDAEAEDVAQEAMLRLWRSADGLEVGPPGLRPVSYTHLTLPTNREV